MKINAFKDKLLNVLPVLMKLAGKLTQIKNKETFTNLNIMEHPLKILDYRLKGAPHSCRLPEPTTLRLC